MTPDRTGPTGPLEGGASPVHSGRTGPSGPRTTQDHSGPLTPDMEITPMSEDLDDQLVTAVDERVAARKAESVRRTENLRRLRVLRKAARDAGLRARHATKLARVRAEGNQP